MIKNKRDSLEQFIRAQMQGPGACNEKYTFHSEEENSSEIDIISTVPGGVYGTAILFPQRTLQDLNKPAAISNIQAEIEENNFSSNENEEEDETEGKNDPNDNLTLEQDDDLFSLSQRFPRSIGLSCCLNTQDNTLITNDNLKITISGRYYNRIPKEDYKNVRITIEKENREPFRRFLEQYKEIIASYFTLHTDGLSINGDFSKDQPIIQQKLREINLACCKSISLKKDNSIDEEYTKTKEEYRYLKSYKEKLWAALNKIGPDKTYLTNESKIEIIDKIAKIELYETFVSYLEDALSLCNTKSFGFWMAQNFSETIDLSSVNLNTNNYKTIFSAKTHSCLNDIVRYDLKDNIQASLSVWLQIINKPIETAKRKTYLKVQLVNTSTPFKEESKHYFSIVNERVNERSFFGVEIKVESDLLCEYRSISNNTDTTSDIAQLNYLYRDIKDYAVGQMCSADWCISEDSKWVKTEFIPTYETPDVEPIPRDGSASVTYVTENEQLVPPQLLQNTNALEFKWLSMCSGATNTEVVDALFAFIDTYGQWIDSIRKASDNSDFANFNIQQCEKDCKRMRSNIELLLVNNDKNIDSFRLMNAAMFIQLWHSKHPTPDKTDNDIEFYKNASDHIFGNFPATWRPFQLAFILLNLDGVIQRQNDPGWEARNELVDLVWFPTGGGKTEAYLGIIAFTIINRRRSEKKRGGGTTAIMRYTLRLLANQQFRRAMRVILALEQLRLWDKYDLGDEPITIGLYVGDDSLPNKAGKLLEESKKWETRTNGKRKESKIPLDICPWCGESLEYISGRNKTKPDIKFRCKNICCTFSDELPVKLCDEYIYQNPPTLLFGTVDKFAALAHKVSNDNKKTNEDSRRLFGQGNNLNYLTPDLIIQDELHLLLGPLGSAVSLFESAIDQLCTRTKKLPDGTSLSVRPKIISSTATTRNTELQIRALYDRDVNIFPKNGTDYHDSFFAFYKRKKEQQNEDMKFVAKRKYMGILPTGRTQMTTQMRLIATMFVHRAVFENRFADKLSTKDVEKAMNFYHSIISYFNSLKEVGKTDAQFYTEFTKYTRRVFRRVLRYSNMLECYYCYNSSFSKSELTGRLKGSEVNDQLAEVETKWSSEKRLPHLDDNTEYTRGKTPPDLILATNMISVGLDVDRFNTIIMNSMPRNIAEYIQASSRVARNDIGLVVTLHNPFRMRDLSHFERFREFHEKLYYYVEPISITPFSKKAVDKYMPLYLATIIRHCYPDLADNPTNLTQEQVTKIQQDLIVYFEQRLSRTQSASVEQKGLLTDELKQHIEQCIKDALTSWKANVDKQESDNYILRYSGSDYLNNKNNKGIIHKDLFLALDAYHDDETQKMWAVPMSLRNVEAEATIAIKEKDE